MNAPKQEVTFPISICLPADEIYSARMGGPRRVMGDPGSTEEFLLPNYIYIIIMKETDADTWTVWEVIKITATESDWVKKRYVGSLHTTGDSIYQYSHEVDRLLSSEKFDGRVYAVASAVELSFNKALTNVGIASKSDLLTLTFDASSETVQQNLQNIYSTPYNYEIADKYYGCFSSNNAKVPHVNLMLYHVAAKVDITWDVADSARVNRAGIDPIRLTRMDACNLFAGNAYCFKPMENSSGSASPLTTSDTITIVSAGDEGLWWEGRSYFYTIPYTTTAKSSYFPLQMRMETNESGDMYTPTIYMQIDKSNPFVPWLRATFNIKKQLTAGSEDKIVDL